ncbi:hypothetical protein M378DRAFT_16826 [Amanita muscaria Koide BX008]|uniref:Uncharacterized protein n=1 Tax=Amanita muscaria (strain Koide BX008) TaxID=946122 RepID=A0A0C2WKM7_AMAMK|nr:hypothetical protein M378DRAFT_16826 [Amanita muscaria Koide BX008]
MSSPTVPSYVFLDTRSPSPTLLIPTPITLPVLAPLPISAYYIPVNNDGITYVHSQASSRAPTPEHHVPRLSTPDPPTSPRWIPVSPSTLTITPPLSTPTSPALITPGLPFTPVIPTTIAPELRHLVRNQSLKDIYERLHLSNNMRERVHRTIGILWDEGNMNLVTHRVTQAGNPMLFDLLEIFQNITHMEFHTPGTEQVQDHLTVDLMLRMLKHGIEHEVYCAMHGATWGIDTDPIFHNGVLMMRAGVNRPVHASIHDRPLPTPRLWVNQDQQDRLTRLLSRSTSTQRDLENQNQALRNLLRAIENPVTAPLDWNETSFLDGIINRQGLAAVPSSVTTVPPFDSLNVNAPPFILTRPLTPHSSREPRQPLTEISMNNPQDLSLVTRRTRRRQRAQNATTRCPNIPPPPTQQRAPQTARRGRPHRQTTRPRSDPNEGLRPDPLEEFYEAAGEWIDGYHGVSD